MPGPLLVSIASRIALIATMVMGVCVGLAHLLMPLAANYQEEIEKAMESALGRQVSVGAVRGRWAGLGPRLILEEVELSPEPGKSAPLRLSGIRVDFNLITSIRAATLVPSMVALTDAHLRLRQEENGNIRLLGINDTDLASEGEGGFDLKDLPLGMGFINSKITLETTRSGDPLQLYDFNLKLHREDDYSKVEADLRVGGHASSWIKVAARLRGDPTRSDDWESDFHFSGEALAIESLLKHFIPTDFKQASGLAELQVWGRLERGHLQKLEGIVSLQGLAVARQAKETISDYRLNQLQGQFRWQSGNGGWRLELVDFQIKRNDTVWPKSSITLQVWRDATRLTRLEASTNFLRLQDLLSASALVTATGEADVQSGIPPSSEPGLVEILQNLQPAGDLQDIRFTFNDGEKTPHWELTGRGERLRMKAWKSFPGISNLSVQVQASPQGGGVNIDSDDVLLDFANGLFKQPIRLRKAKGGLRWQQSEQELRLQAENLEIDTPDFTTRSRLSLVLPAGGSPQLDLQTHLSQGNVAKMPGYLPGGIMNPNLVKRLNRGLVAGTITSGTILFHGPLNDFPFDKDPSGRFEAVIGVEDAIFDYQEGWPRLEGMDAELHFLNNSFDGKIYEASIYSSKVEKAVAKIESLEPTAPLVLDGEVSGPLADDLRVLGESPLSVRFGPIVSEMEVTGDARLAIHLYQPLALDDNRESQVSGTLQFQDNHFKMPKWEVDLANARGELFFDENKVWAKEIKAKGLGSDLRIEVESPKEGPRRTLIHGRGRYDVKTLVDRYVGIPLPFIKGTTDWHLTVDLPHSSRSHNTSTELNLETHLDGIAIDLPPPMGKLENSHQPLRISLTPVASQKPMPVRVQLEGVADAQLLMSRSQNGGRNIDRVGISFGGTPASPPDQEGLHISGQLSRFRLDPWVEMLPPSQRNGATGGESGQEAPRFRLKEVDVNFGRFEYKDVAFDQIRLKGGPNPNGWSGWVESPRIKGLVELPTDLTNGTIRLDLEQYVVTTDKGEVDKPAPPNKLDPRTMPSLQVDSKHLIFNGHDLGSLVLRANKRDTGLFFDQLKVKSSWFSLDATGSWIHGKFYPGCSSRFSVETKDLGKLLEAFAFTANIKGAPGRIEGALTWSGDPTDVKGMNLTGDLDLRLRKGGFTDLEPGVGRVFGLLNLGALQRRLTLDFSDFFGKGLGFDRIEGKFTLDDGDAYTHNLVIEGPTGVINLSGRTGLISKDFDQQVTVTPDLTGTLATAGAIAGGPVVGAALYLTNKIIGRELNKVSTTRYQVSGPWDNPKIESSTVGRRGETPSGSIGKGEGGSGKRRFDIHNQ